VRQEDVPRIIDRLARHYLSVRLRGETFIEAVDRLGANAFKAALEVEEHVAA
jgi:sulfite reductase beta subunit-like hemoprotein